MCGRFRVARSKEILEGAFDAEDSLSPVDWSPRYNVAPGQEIAVVRQNAARRASATGGPSVGPYPSLSRPVRRL
jgi:putative SOS response-associated peptidase YedK